MTTIEEKFLEKTRFPGSEKFFEGFSKTPIASKTVKKGLLALGPTDWILLLEAAILGLPIVGLLYLVKGKNWTVKTDSFLRSLSNPQYIPRVSAGGTGQPPKTVTGGFDSSWQFHNDVGGTINIDSNGNLNVEADFPDKPPIGSNIWGPYGDISAQIGWQDYGKQVGPVILPNSGSTVDMKFTDQGTTVKTQFPGAHYSGDGFIAFYYHLVKPQTSRGVTCPNLDIQYLLWSNTDSPGGQPFYTTFQDGTPKSFHIDRPWMGPVNLRQIAADYAKTLGIDGSFDSMGIEVGGEGYRVHLKGQFGIVIR